MRAAAACGWLALLLQAACTATPGPWPASPAPAAPLPASEPAAAQMRQAVTQLADALASDFVYPDVGGRYAGMLRTRLAAGDYDRLQGAALAERLTADLQAVQADGHVRVRWTGTGEAPSSAGGPGTGPATSPPTANVPPVEPGRWLAPGIAFVRLNLMASTPESAEAARSVMAAHRDARVLIIDLRTNNGGGLAEMDAMFPFLFDRPRPLVRMATRRSVFEREGDGPLAGLPSLRAVEGDPAFVTREHWVVALPLATGLQKAKVYVLTAGRTASAAEHFCLAMKATGRATLVGEPTAGANHFGYGLELPGELEAFIPVGRTFDPASGQDWEGTGVLPDLPTAAPEALVRVLTLEGLPADQAARLSAEVAPVKSMLRRRQVG